MEILLTETINIKMYLKAFSNFYTIVNSNDIFNLSNETVETGDSGSKQAFL
jgi:hypothetical protein